MDVDITSNEIHSLIGAHMSEIARVANELILPRDYPGQVTKIRAQLRRVEELMVLVPDPNRYQ